MSTRAIAAGQRVRWVLLRRRLQAEAARDRSRTWGLVAVGVGLGAIIFGVAFFGGWFAVKKNAPELVMTGTVAGLTGVALALVFSSLGHAAQAFFSAKDLWLWEVAPTGAFARFIDRSTETAVAALPPTLALGTIGLGALQLGAGAGVAGALRGVVAVVLVAPVPVAFGVLLAHLGGAILPAGRLRRLSLVFLGVFLTAGLVWFRRLRVERMLTERGAAELLGAARDVGTMGPSLLPPRQLALFVVDGSVSGLLIGLAGVVVAVAIAFAGHVALYDRARKLAVDESPTGVLRGSLGARVLDRIVQPLAPDIRPVVQKDLLSFVRDPGQWGQVILLVGVGVLYVVNASALGEGLRQLGEFGSALLTAMHVGIVAFIAGGLSARFAFPQVGLEGPAIWIIDGAPLSAARLLRAKWVSAIPVAAAFPALLGLVGAMVLDLGFVRVLWTSALIAWCAVLFAGLGVARGAHKPMFDAASLSELAMGPGAISTILQATLMAGLASLAALGVAGLGTAVERESVSAAAGVGIAVLVLAVPMGLMWVLVGKALADAIRGLHQRRVDGGQAAVALASGVETLD